MVRLICNSHYFEYNDWKISRTYKTLLEFLSAIIIMNGDSVKTYQQGKVSSDVACHISVVY